MDVVNQAYRLQHTLRRTHSFCSEFSGSVSNAETNNYSYSNDYKTVVDTLVPLEMIFRFGLTEGSSLFERSKNPEYLKDLALEEADLYPGKVFEKPVI